MMTVLRVLILLLTTSNSIYGEIVDWSEAWSNSDSLQPVEEVVYRPWENNVTSRPWISLNGMGITTFNDLFRLNVCNLEWLVMDNNNIRTIPSHAFKYWPDLTYISLAANQISTISYGAFSSLDKLQVLDLNNNYMQNFMIGTGIFETLTALESLYLRSCHLGSFDFSAPMKSLSHLYLSNNALRTFHANSESPVTHLYLDNNNLAFVSLANFTSLLYLNVSGNRLRNIKAYLGEPIDDTLLQYIGTGWSSEPSALYIEYSPNLRHLIVSGNELADIQSDSFLGTETLTHVDFSNNKITQVHAGTFNDLLELESILLDSNQITQINYRTFVNLPKVKIISLKNNLIQNVDEDAFTKLNSTANEVYLFLDNNEIDTLNRGSFMDIKGLKHIGLSNNKIKTILFNAFANLPNLESVTIENQYRDKTKALSQWDAGEVKVPSAFEGSIDSRAFSNLPNLTSIIIRGNVFTEVAAEAFHELPKLKVLDLSNNSIEYLSSEAFSVLPQVETLYLGQNRLSKIEPGTYPKQLKNLDLSQNYPCLNLSCWNIDELSQLERLDIFGIAEQFTIEDLEKLPKKLVVMIQ